MGETGRSVVRASRRVAGVPERRSASQASGSYSTPTPGTSSSPGWSLTPAPVSTSPDEMKEGQTKKEAIRCVKRYIAREVYDNLPMDHVAVDGPLKRSFGDGLA